MLFVLLALLQAAPSPAAVPTDDPSAAVIRNSGSTNTLPYTIVVHPDGSADVTTDETAVRRTLPKEMVSGLFEKLAAANPLDALPAPHCMRSASFGTSTTIAFGGRRTPDLNCAGSPAVRDLADATSAIVHKLDLELKRLHPGMQQH
jgi:hypothetical protein